MPATKNFTGPLSGIKVIEIGSFIAGPFCGQLLADFGADVIKIEPPQTGDSMRTWGNARATNGQSLWWSVIGRNKRSMTLDLRQKEGQKILRRLLGRADVLVENFRPGTLEKWGLAPASLHAANPKLIIARVSGFGQTGPYSEKAGFGSVAEAMAGMRHLSGYPDRVPVRAGLSIGDSLAGLHSVIGVLLAIVARSKEGGKGQVVDVAITESVLSVMESVVSEYAATGAIRERTGAVLPGIAPSNLYPTSDGQQVLIAANADTLFRKLCEAMQMPELCQDPKFSKHQQRGANQKELDDIVGAWSAGFKSDELVAMMDTFGIPAGTVNDAAAVASDLHFRQREAIIEVPDAELGSITMQGTFPRLSGTPGKVRWSGPSLGCHTEEILKERLGLSPEEIEGLSGQGAI